MSGIFGTRGAHRKGAPFALWLAGLLLWGAILPARADCPADHIDRWGHVAYVYDGDTIRLENGQRIRFIGVNTPEIAHKPGEQAQPFGNRARDALRQRLHRGARVGLRFDRERHDRYGRVLAHLYFNDGQSVADWLLRQGLGTTLFIPPNLWNEPCYRRSERQARTAGRGLWALPAYQPIESTALPHTSRGYHLVQGRVVHVGHSRRALWLDLEGGVALRIPRSDLAFFTTFTPDTLLGKRVLARGWLHPARRRNEVQMTVRSPAALDMLEP